MAETLLQPLAYRVAPAGKGGDEPAARRITRYRIRLPGLTLGRVRYRKRRGLRIEAIAHIENVAAIANAESGDKQGRRKAPAASGDEFARRLRQRRRFHRGVREADGLDIGA